MSRFAHRNSSVSAALLLVVLDVVHHHRHWELGLCGIATRVATYSQVKDHEEPQLRQLKRGSQEGKYKLGSLSFSPFNARSGMVLRHNKSVADNVDSANSELANGDSRMWASDLELDMLHCDRSVIRLHGCWRFAPMVPRVTLTLVRSHLENVRSSVFAGWEWMP